MITLRKKVHPLSYQEQTLYLETHLKGKIIKALNAYPNIDNTQLVALIWKLEAYPHKTSNACDFLSMAKEGRLTPVESIIEMRQSMIHEQAN